MKRENKVTGIQDAEGIEIIIEASDLLKYEELLIKLLGGVREQLSTPYCQDSTKTTREVLQEDNKPQQ